MGPERDVWVNRILSLADSAVPQLIDCLHRDDARACASAEAALLQLAERSGEGGQRTRLAQLLADAFPRASLFGQPSVLNVEAAVFAQAGDEQGQILSTIVPLLFRSQAIANKGVQASRLELVRALIAKTSDGTALHACRELVRAALRNADSEIRTEALQLAMHPRISQEKEVLSLLDDPAPEVRRLAIVVLAPCEETVSPDDLLHCLHDADQEVRRLCETALRSRRLTETQIRLGRTLTDSQPSVRLQVLEALRRNSDLEPGVWLRRLSHDAEPAVRAAAIRAALAQPLLQFGDRLVQMCQSDPSPTVRQLAAHYRGIQRDHKPEGQGRSQLQ